MPSRHVPQLREFRRPSSRSRNCGRSCTLRGSAVLAARPGSCGSLAECRACGPRESQFDQAQSWFKRAVVTRKPGDVHGRADPASLGRSRHQVGYCYARQDQFAQALLWLEVICQFFATNRGIQRDAARSGIRPSASALAGCSASTTNGFSIASRACSSPRRPSRVAMRGQSNGRDGKPPGSVACVGTPTLRQP